MLLHNPAPGWPDQNIFLLLTGYHSSHRGVFRSVQAWLWYAKLDHLYLPLEKHRTHVCAILQFTVEKKHIQPKLNCNLGIFKCQRIRIWLEQIHRLSSKIIAFSQVPKSLCAQSQQVLLCNLLQAAIANAPLQRALSTQVKALLCVTHLCLSQLTAESLHTRKL